MDSIYRVVFAIFNDIFILTMKIIKVDKSNGNYNQEIISSFKAWLKEASFAFKKENQLKELMRRCS